MTRVILIMMCVATSSLCLGGSPPSQLANRKMSQLGIPPGPTREYDVPPKFISGDAPKYPISAVLQKISGEATIEFTIDEHGTARDFKIVSASDKYFANHTIIAMRNWRFEPARKNGRPVASHCRMPFKFGGWKFEPKPHPGD